MNHIAGAADFERSFGVSRETLERLETYAGLLATWQRTINLVAPGTVNDVWHRHFADSAQLLAWAPSGPLNWVDLGSGGGFPGLVIAIMLAERPGSKVRLIESDSRKCAFLREVARKVGLGPDSGASVAVDIVTSRIESVANTSKEGPIHVVSARALAPLDKLLGWCQPFFGAATLGLFPKGRGVQAELDVAQLQWRMDADLRASLTDAEGRIVLVRSLRPA